MQFLRILPILVLLPVLAFADGDKMFRVTTDQYKVGDLFEPFPEMAIKVSGSVTSTAPSLPLNENNSRCLIIANLLLNVFYKPFLTI